MSEKFTLVDDDTGCQHWLDGPTRSEEEWEVGRCATCHNEIAYELNGAGKRTGETRLVKWLHEDKK
jgi:hypothetical protein